jgi:hypothetical protein
LPEFEFCPILFSFYLELLNFEVTGHDSQPPPPPSRPPPTNHQFESRVTGRQPRLLPRLPTHVGCDESHQKKLTRNQKTRWATCSSKNNINLNMNLVNLFQALPGSVILHQSVHTKHGNHSRKFWAEMDKLVGDAEKLKKSMRE